MKTITTIFVTLMLFSSCAKENITNDCGCGQVINKWEDWLWPNTYFVEIQDNCADFQGVYQKHTEDVTSQYYVDVQVGDYVCNY
jgi:hypothetical protein